MIVEIFSLKNEHWTAQDEDVIRSLFSDRQLGIRMVFEVSLGEHENDVIHMIFHSLGG